MSAATTSSRPHYQGWLSKNEERRMVDQLHGRDRWRLGLIAGTLAFVIGLLRYPIGLHGAWWFDSLVAGVIGGVSAMLATFVVRKWRG